MATSEEYDELDKKVIEIYLDYCLDRFPIDVLGLARRMGAQLVPYSSFGGEELELLRKKSSDGFYCPREGVPMIFYNDVDCYKERIRMTVGHEIKHYVFEDVEEDKERDPLATHFARYLLCPTPILVYLGIDNPYEVMAKFDIGYEASCNALRAADGRMLTYGGAIFDYERPLIELFKWMKEDS